MKEKFLVLLIGLILIVGINSPVVGFNSPFSVDSISGGIGLLTLPGEFEDQNGDKWGYDFSFAPYLNCLIMYNKELPINLSLSASSHSAAGKYDDKKLGKLQITGGNLDFFQLTANGKYSFSIPEGYRAYLSPEVSPYFTGGLGVYNWSGDVEAKGFEHTIKNQITGGFDAGLNLGLGVEYKLQEEFKLNSEVRYHLFLNDYYTGGSFSLTTLVSYSF